MSDSAATPLIEIQALSPALVDDFLRFFDHDAFTDNPNWASCYCLYYHVADSSEVWEARTADQNRAAKTALIRAGTARGYLAYMQGKPVGWCNAAPRALLPLLAHDPRYQIGAADGVGTIVCFVIAPEYRRQGIAGRLLDAACAGFRELGLAFAEAYPAKQPQSDASAYHGPLPLYKAAGFTVVRDLGDYLQVRKAVG